MNTIKKFFISSLTDDDGKINKDLVSLVFRPIIATLYLIMMTEYQLENMVVKNTFEWFALHFPFRINHSKL